MRATTLLVAGIGVGDDEKRGLQPPGVVHDRKIVLMMDHRRRQHFFRQRQEFLRERSGHHGRIFDEIGHLLEQRRVKHGRAADPPAQAARLRFEPAGDAILALLPVENHEMFGEASRVVVERAHLDRPPRPAARRQEAMAVRDGCRHDFLDRRRFGQLGAADRERDDAPAVQVENPANRPPEQQIAFAVLEKRVPLHRLREAERAQRRRQHIRQHVDGGFAALMFAIAEIRAFRRFDALELCDVDVVFAREPDGRRRRSASRRPNAAATGGPVSSSSRSVCRSAIFAMRAVNRRGVL